MLLIAMKFATADVKLFIPSRVYRDFILNEHHITD